MKKYRRCTPCAGSGKVMGGGMLFNDCDNCYGTGKIEELDKQELELLELKETLEYQNVYREEMQKLKKKNKSSEKVQS